MSHVRERPSPGWARNQQQEPGISQELELQTASGHGGQRALSLPGLKRPDALDLTLRCSAAYAAATTATPATTATTTAATSNDVSSLQSFGSKVMTVAAQSDSESPSSKLLGCLNEAHCTSGFAGDGTEETMMTTMGDITAGASADQHVRATLAAADVAAEGRIHAAHAADSLLSQLEKLEAEWMAGTASKKPRYSHVIMHCGKDEAATHGDHNKMDVKPLSTAAPGSTLSFPLQHHLHCIQAAVRTQHSEHSLEDSPDQQQGAAFSPSLRLVSLPQPLPSAGAVPAAASGSEAAAKDSAAVAPAAASGAAAPIQPHQNRSKGPRECRSAVYMPFATDAAVESSCAKQPFKSSPVLLSSSSSFVHVLADSRVIVPRSAWAQAMVVNHLEQAQGDTSDKHKSGSMPGEDLYFEEVPSSVMLSHRASGKKTYSSGKAKLCAIHNDADTCLCEGALGECSGKHIHGGRGVVACDHAASKVIEGNMGGVEMKEAACIIILGKRIEAEPSTTLEPMPL
ncbi:hypothetical protein CLOM_g2217 [Closterium sp. NIES-68]|nr:hypothetical protein CLOM_g2217 [Closterium sp. NIES-68]